MSGKKPISKMSHDYNPEFDRLMRDAEHNRLNPHLSDAYTRPIYYGTRLQREVENAKNNKTSQ